MQAAEEPSSARELLSSASHHLEEVEALRVKERTLETASAIADHLQALRGVLRELLVQHPQFAWDNGVDEKLWRKCFYQQIDSMRRQLKRAAADSATEEAAAFIQKANRKLSKILSDALSFYSALLHDQEELLHTYAPETPVGQVVVKAIHRSFIYLGDIARYQELHSDGNEKDFARAEEYYLKALAVVPGSGNPHNQLGVIAQTSKAECVAVYRFCRALMATQKFTNAAEENLANLFNSNKDAVQHSGPSQDIVGRLRALSRSNSRKKRAAISRERADIIQNVLRRFIRLHGILFHRQSDRSNTPPKSSKTKAAQRVLVREDLNAEVGGFLHLLPGTLIDIAHLLQASYFSDSLLLNLVIICIFSVDKSRAQHRQAGVVLALALLFGIMAKVVDNIPRSLLMVVDTARKTTIRNLAPTLVFCDWLTLEPRYLYPTPANPPQDNACSEQFWRLAIKAEHEARQAFDESFRAFVSHIEDSKQQGRLSAVSQDTFDYSRPMKEHLELRGCAPFADKYERFFAAQKSSTEILSEGIACERRLVDILRFMQQLYGPSHGGYTAPEAPSTRSGHDEHNSSHNDDSTVLPDDHLADEFDNGQEFDQPAMEISVAVSSVAATAAAAAPIAAAFDEDDLDEEVITFKPAFSKRTTTPSPAPSHFVQPSATESLVQGAAIAEQSAAMLLDAEEQPTSAQHAVSFSPLPSIDTDTTVWSGWLPKSATLDMAGLTSSAPASPFGVQERPSWSLGTSLGLPDSPNAFRQPQYFPQQSAFGLGLSSPHHPQLGQPPQWHPRYHYSPQVAATPPPGFEAEGNGFNGHAAPTSNPFFTG